MCLYIEYAAYIHRDWQGRYSLPIILVIFVMGRCNAGWFVRRIEKFVCAIGGNNN